MNKITVYITSLERFFYILRVKVSFINFITAISIDYTGYAETYVDSKIIYYSL